jgi:glycosyltransferase involved in cell wall biosynthesis
MGSAVISRERVLDRASSEFQPIRLTEVELSEPLPALDGAGEDTADGAARFGVAWVLVRLFGEPLGVVTVELPADGGLDPASLGAVIRDALGSEIAERSELPDHDSAGAPALGPSPFISVVVCTRGRPQRLGSCLEAVCKQDYPHFELVVVDNAPTDDQIERIVSELAPDAPMPVRRVVEPVAGLSRARNRGAREARGEVIAYIDDDELPDVKWLAELSAGFALDPGVGCVTGMILPASLTTEPQALFEEYGGHSKGRGFSQLVFHDGPDRPQDPLYPLPPFGAGGNMAFTRGALHAIGGFDPALGAGTITKGGEDTAAFTDLLLNGFRLVYRPAALVWHHHYADLEGLRRQLNGYGTGLTCFYTRIALRRPRYLMRLVAMLPRGLRDLRGANSVRRQRMSSAFPRELLKAHRRGMLVGPFAYVLSLLRQVGRHA